MTNDSTHESVGTPGGSVGTGLYVAGFGVARRRRGRLPGTDAKPRCKKPGRKPAQDKKKGAAALAEAEEAVFQALEDKRTHRVENEGAISLDVQSTYEKRMESAEADKWMVVPRRRSLYEKCMRNV